MSLPGLSAVLPPACVRVLLVHNFHRARTPSGEVVVAVWAPSEDVQAEVQLGRRARRERTRGAAGRARGRVGEGAVGHGRAAWRPRKAQRTFGRRPQSPGLSSRIMGVSVRGSVSFAACLAVAAWALPASSQTAPGGQAGTAVLLPAAVPRSAEFARGQLVLEGAVDPDVYLVGPGDVFTVSIGGSLPRQVTSAVSADGRLVVPEAGNFQVAGRSLARVRGEVQAALQRRYQNVTADLALSEPRQFYVHVSGRVPEPGRLLVPAVARVEDALVEASGDGIAELSGYGSGGALIPALRNVAVTGRAGGTRTVDLMRYLATGDLASNPYLLDGDALYVPAFDPLVEGVLVSGAVDRPGAYDVRTGDTALDLLTVTSGRDPSARIARVRRIRPTGSGVTETREVAFADAATLDVRAQDVLYAVEPESDAEVVTVAGAVRYPGQYTITEDRTTVAELVALAGGLRDDALVRAATLERPRGSGTAQATFDRRAGAEAGDAAAETVAPDVSVDSDLLGGIFSRQFFASQTERTPRVAFNPVQAIIGAERVTLVGGDVLTVPFDLGVVRVYGRVRSGGYVPYMPGATTAAYIERAGGLAATASQVYVVDAVSGQLVEDAAAVVQPGDAVFVNSLPTPDTAEFAQLALQERQDTRNELSDAREARFRLAQTIFSAVATVTSVVIAYFTVQAARN